MGWGQSKYIVESELSEEESEESYQQMNDNNIMEITNLAKNLNAVPSEEIDALSPLTHLEYDNIELSDIKTFEENDLEEYEIVSLIYLLNDDCAVALNDIKRMLISENNDGYIYKWALNRTNNNWKLKLIEALCIIQNYKILKDLGFGKGDLIATFLPSQHNESFEINKRKKVLYLIAEQLTSNKTAQFISKIEELLKKRNISCPDDFARDYLELYFLYLESHNVDLMEIKSILKVLDCENCVWQLELVLSSTTSGKKNLVEHASAQKYKKSVSTAKDNTYFASEFNSYISNNSSRGSLEPENDYIKYDINSDNPGVVLIINQEEFYTETEPKYRHLLYEKSDEFKLESRKGTEKDKTRLELLFKKMKFTVISNRQNLPHFSLISTIEETTNAVTDESSLIICILSHGDKGVVYGANSCKVQIDDIKKIMCRNKNLNGKPKVLILQSCQGIKCQNLEPDVPDLDAIITIDGPLKLSSTTDLLVFFATIPGFAAIRNTNTGSWFIQALCEEIEKGHEKHHFLDICTKANQRVTSQIWSCGSTNNVMTPMFESTFTKFFFLPRLKK